MGKKNKNKSKNKTNKPSLKKFIKENGKNNVQSKNQEFEYPPIQHNKEDGLWKVVFVKNYALFGNRNRSDSHTAIPIGKNQLDEYTVIAITHSKKTSGNNNKLIKNIEKGKEEPSYVIRDIKSFLADEKRNKDESNEKFYSRAKGIKIKDFDEMKDVSKFRDFDDKEISEMLESLNQKPVNREKYHFFKKKKNNQSNE